LDIILNNPFRVLGVPVNASERKIKKNIQDFEVFISIGKQPKRQETDFDFMGSVERNSNSLNETIQKIEAPKDRINQSLFWFSKLTEIDEKAFDDLSNNELDEAIDIWKSSIIDNKITKYNFTSYKNLGVLYFYKAFQNGKVDLNNLRKSITLYGKSLNSDEFWSLYISHFNNSILLSEANRKESSSYLFKTIFDEIQDKYKIEEDVNFYTNLLNLKQIPSEIKNEIVSRIIFDKILFVEAEIDKCNISCKSHKPQSYNFGNDLYNNIKEVMKFLLILLENSDYRYQMLSNKAANEFLNCAISTYNNDIDERYINNKVETLLNYADEYAIDDLVRKRVRDNEDDFRNALKTNGNNRLFSAFFMSLEDCNNRLNNFEHPYTLYTEFSVVLIDTLSIIDDTVDDNDKSMILNLASAFFRNCAVKLSYDYKDFIRSKEILEASINYVKDPTLKRKIVEDLNIVSKNINTNINYDSYDEHKSANKIIRNKKYTTYLIFVGGMLITIILLVIAISSHESYNTESTKINFQNTISNNNPSSSNKKTTKTNVETTKEEKANTIDDSEKDLKVTRLKTGATPYDSYFSNIRTDKNSYCQLILINETDDDALISLVNNSNDKVIRCVYVRSNDRYTIRNIPQGKYYMKTYTGTDWSNEKFFRGNKIQGGFKNHGNFSSFSSIINIKQYNTSEGISYYIGKWTLYTLSSTNDIDYNSSSENEFFKE